MKPATKPATKQWTTSPSAVAGAVTKHGAVLLVSLAAIVPIYFMVSTSFKTEVQYAQSQLALPTSPTLVNYEQILGNPMFLTWIRNSFLLTVLSVGIGITISALAAYALACMDFPGRHVVFMVFVALLGAPAVTVAIPLFRVMVEAKLINTLQGAVVAYVGLMIPYTTYFLTGFFRRLPPALFEAAKLDGADHLMIFRKIAAPAVAPRRHHARDRQHPLGVERAVDRHHLPAAQRQEDAHGRAHSLPRRVLEQRPGNHGGPRHRGVADVRAVRDRCAVLPLGLHGRLGEVTVTLVLPVVDCVPGRDPHRCHGLRLQRPVGPAAAAGLPASRGGGDRLVPGAGHQRGAAARPRADEGRCGSARSVRSTAFSVVGLPVGILLFEHFDPMWVTGLMGLVLLGYAAYGLVGAGTMAVRRHWVAPSGILGGSWRRAPA